MAHIDFNLTKWTSENPNANKEDLAKAIENADEVFCGWTVEDAETVRKEVYSDRTDLYPEDSNEVMLLSANSWDANIGHSWNNLYQAYEEYVDNLNAYR